MIRIALCAAVVAAAPAAAQQTAEVYELRSVEIAPHPLNAAAMAALLNTTYPAALRLGGVSGTVKVSMVVGADGVPRDLRVTESADSAFNAPTLAAVQMLRFSPAELNDQPVSVRVELPVQWQAPAPAGPDSTGTYALSQVTEVPYPRDMNHLSRIMHEEMPPGVLDQGDYGTVQVGMRVDERGVPGDVRILQSNNTSLNEAALRVARRMRFQPGRLRGQAVPVYLEFPLAWNEKPAN